MKPITLYNNLLIKWFLRMDDVATVHQNEVPGGEEVVQCLGALVALVDDIGSLPNTLFMAHNLPMTSESTMLIGSVH